MKLSTWNNKLNTDEPWNNADRMVEETADAIQKQVSKLLDKTAALRVVAPDYVIGRLLETLASKNPEVFAWLDRQPGDGSMRLSAALQDWMDLRTER